jgi:Nucleotidyl transferase AbiEii toxin, Type IV TA system
MPLDDLHRDVASVALGVASEHGFVLGGGNALIAHGIIDRPTEDVDLMTNQEHGVRAASAAVESALTAAGYRTERQDKSAGIDDIFARSLPPAPRAVAGAPPLAPRT